MTDHHPQSADLLTQSVPIAAATAQNFFSSGLRQKVDGLMNTLWAGGVNNPMDAIEQVSYLLFLRLLSEQDELLGDLDRNYTRIFSGDWAAKSWQSFVILTGDQLFDAVRTAIESLQELPGLSATARLLFNRATLKIYDRPTLRAVVQSLDGPNFSLEGRDGSDLKGDMYEYLLGKLSVSGTNGQFRTPRHIIDMIVALVDPQPHHRICDPACGTAGFLVAALSYIKRKHTSLADLSRGHISGDNLTPAQWKFLEEHAFTGYDNDANMVKIAILNLYLHQLEHADIEFHNPLSSKKGSTYPGALLDVILANPPFAGKLQEPLADINLNTRSTELLFLKWMIDHLSDEGRAGVIVPNGVLFGSTGAAKRVRELLLTECRLQAVISLPSGVFKPYSGVGTAALIFAKGGPTESVWFYDLTADGFSLDDKRTPIAANDIPDVLAKWPGREEGSNSYRVSIERIRENDLSLAAGRYKPVTASIATHDAPCDILAEIAALEADILARSQALAKALCR